MIPSLVLTLTGALAGGTIAGNLLGLLGQPVHCAAASFYAILCLGAGAGVVLVFCLRWCIRRLLAKTPLSRDFLLHYRLYDTYAYLPFLLFLALGAGLQISLPIVYLVVAGFLCAQVLLLLCLYSTSQEGPDFFQSTGWLVLLFLVSGMAALIYEIVWQRVLFAAYGINIESVTVIVSLFMFGLGVGSLLGGLLSRRFPNQLAYLFVLCECGIGAFGLLSLPLIQFVASKTINLSLTGITLTIYALLCLPTIFMGATLPILVTYLHQHWRHIGQSVGLLYCFNTIGSALACMLTVDVLFVFLGRQATVCFAVLLNVLVAWGVFVYARRRGRARLTTVAQVEPRSEAVAVAGARSCTLPFPLVLVISAVSGYLSLSQEILWVRAVSYQAQGIPQIFGHVLGFFLLGIALGALSGKRFCDKGHTHPLAFMAQLFLAGSLVYYLCIPLFTEAALLGKGASLILSYVTVALVAFVFGHILPIISHFGIRPGWPVGMSLAWIYMANIAGATLGPMLTGFILLDKFSLEHNILYISAASLACAGIVALAAPIAMRQRMWLATGAVAAITLVVGMHGSLYSHLLEKLHYGPRFHTQSLFNHIVQNRSGIITVQPDPKGDIIYGGGGYDGRFNLDPVLDSNGIRRGYMVAALHANPVDVLEIGLSSASWAWVLAAYDKIKRLTIVEINPGYPQVIASYDDGHQEVLANPKVALHFDDGRRWLHRHPDRRFDFMLMNTTFHWRSNITNLVSQEFLVLAKQHLKPGGVLYYNATGSPDIIYTAARVFRHVTTYSTFVAASDAPFALTEAEKLTNFSAFRDAGTPLFDASRSAWQGAAVAMARTALPAVSQEYLARADLRLITDDNMLTEFKKISDMGIIGRLYRWYNPALTWPTLWALWSAVEACQ